MITAAPAEGPRSLLADWLELEVLCRRSGAASIFTITFDPAIDPDAESEIIDEDGVRNETRLARTITEIEQRQKILGDAYPFRMTPEGTMLQRSKTGVGPSVYLFCLLASHGRAGGFLHETDILVMKDIPDLMQACATWSAAGFERGPSYALGIDPSSNAFLPRLAEIYSAFGDGVTVQQIPKGAPRQVKDDGIDVIAWHQMPDHKPPASYMMAQVASGLNWRTKTARAAIERFLSTWFSPAPARNARPAIMIPYCIEPECDEDEDTEQEALALQWRRIVGEFGQLLYRYQLPLYAADGVALHHKGVHVDMIDWLEPLNKFIEGAIANLQAGYG